MTTASEEDNQLQALLNVVERLRAQQFPHLDADLVREVLRHHSDSGATAGELVRAVEQAVERRLAKG